MKTILRYSLFFLPQFVFPGWVFCFASQNILLPILTMFTHFTLVYLTGYLLIARLGAPEILIFQMLVYCCSLVLQIFVALRLLAVGMHQHASNTPAVHLDAPSVSLRSTVPFLVLSFAAISLSHHKGWSFSLVKAVHIDSKQAALLDTQASIRFCTKAVSEQFRIKGTEKFLGHLAQVKIRGKPTVGRIIAAGHQKVAPFFHKNGFGCLGFKENAFKADLSLIEEIKSLPPPTNRKFVVLYERSTRGEANPSLTISTVDLTDMICLLADPMRNSLVQTTQSPEGC